MRNPVQSQSCELKIVISEKRWWIFHMKTAIKNFEKVVCVWRRDKNVEVMEINNQEAQGNVSTKIVRNFGEDSTKNIRFSLTTTLFAPWIKLNLQFKE